MKQTMDYRSNKLPLLTQCFPIDASMKFTEIPSDPLKKKRSPLTQTQKRIIALKTSLKKKENP